jgi:hypothetical protein
MDEFNLDQEDYPDMVNTVNLYTIRYKKGLSGEYIKTLVLTYQTEVQDVEELEREATSKGVNFDSMTVFDVLHPQGWLVSVR